MQKVYDLRDDVISLEGECIVFFRTLCDDGNLVLEYETEERDYDTRYWIKLKRTGAVWRSKKQCFLQVRRIKA